ncbi:ferredoxin [Spiroplasma endosymbiont of Panorpa germanica]|uniref:ferredoxin n=1 Tax=Spiroplasma endosymbiont of Panorpa germanica TaxID=3066314 RepID=UPI0030D2D488
MDKKRTWIDQSICIGCQACVEMDENDILFMDENGLAQAKPNDLKLEESQMVCPTGAVNIDDN